MKAHEIRHAGAAAASVCAAVLTAAVAAAQPFAEVPALNTNAATDTHDDGAVALATDAKGRWVAVWETQNNLGGNPAMHDWDIVFAVSSDDGRTWSAPAPIDFGALDDHAMDNNPVLATDGAGTWIAAWQSRDARGAIGDDTDVLWSRSGDDGRSWSKPAAISATATSDTGQDFFPALLALPGNVWLLAWESTDPIARTGKDSDILLARSSDAGRTWSTPAPLHADAVSDKDADKQVVLAADGKGAVLAGWKAFASSGGSLGQDWDVLLARSEDAGQTWTQPKPIVESASRDGLAGDEGLAFATDGQGRWLAAWASYVAKPGDAEDDWDIFLAESADAGRTWSAPVSLNAPFKSDSNRDLEPEIAFDGAGRWVVVWYSKDALGKTKGTDGGILVSVSDDGRNWTPTQVLAEYERSDGRSYDDRPSIAADGKGRVLVAWSGNFSVGGKTGTDGDLRVVAMTKGTIPTASAPAPPAVAATQASSPAAAAPASLPKAPVESPAPLPGRGAAVQ